MKKSGLMVINNGKITIPIIPEYDYASDEAWEKALNIRLMEQRKKKLEKIKKRNPSK